ncbi:putative T-box transcription factor TBX18 [Penaeus vannamei]|uniref:Putative T-box transcription factor TBX18 n=1 Tax=Penaeus vannamei TaxID=6689 RepID=A0A423ST51_PENVA|nr:putative T-box transcription factor TBX18 [Penaeus vannamei]
MTVTDAPTSLLQMLSSRAAAFSVKALLTAPGHQEAKEDEALREIKHEGEAPSPRDEPSESPVEASSAQDEVSAAPSPAATSGPSRGGASGSPVSVICRTPGAGSPTPSLSTPASVCAPAAPQQYQDKVFLPQSPSGRADWQVYPQSAPLGVRWVGPETVGSKGDGDISIHLLQQDLWAKFHSLGTEMIITKNGRRMFPVVKVCLRGLDPEKNYMVYMDMAAVDTRRYRYVYPSSRWMVAGTGEPLGDQAPYIHPDSPSSGVQWMASPTVAFDRLKLTNNKTRESRGQIILHSMQKYQPRIWVQEVSAGASSGGPARLWTARGPTAPCRPCSSVVFITVTAYQNSRVPNQQVRAFAADGIGSQRHTARYQNQQEGAFCQERRLREARVSEPAGKGPSAGGKGSEATAYQNQQRVCTSLLSFPRFSPFYLPLSLLSLPPSSFQSFFSLLSSLFSPLPILLSPGLSSLSPLFKFALTEGPAGHLRPRKTCWTAAPRVGLAHPDPPRSPGLSPPAGVPLSSPPALPSPHPGSASPVRPRGPLSPPISPLLLPPHPWLPVADPVDASPMEGGGVRPLAPWGVAELSRAAPSAFLPAAAAAAASAPPGHPFFISSLLTTGAGPLPPALDLSKRKGDT